ncbi:MAG TPA: carboxypeptidase-like regulatory domain-containing protein [Vicinamibacterales bacterium]|nr:carboxypeptidase-like regulatory domain-containing protein [Vicinamibacterales bacterium]
MRAGILAVLAVAFVAPQLRDVQQYPSGTSTLAGTVVVDEAGDQPLRRASVSLVLLSDVRVQFQTVTDDRGRFSFSGLPAANVRLIVSKPTYVQTYYGAQQPGSTVGLPIALTDRETTTVSVRVPRGSVIAGTVVDENGQPMSGISIQVSRVGVSASGQRTFAPAGRGAVIAPATDDRGAYRFYGLPPGDYVVAAQPRTLANAEVRQTSAAELQWAERQIRGGGGNAAAADAQPPAQNQTKTFAPVYFPGALNRANAAVVSLGVGQERTGIDLTMAFVPTAHLEGTVTGADGQPARGVQVMLFSGDDAGPDGAAAEAERLAVMLEMGLLNGNGTASTQADGSFSIVGVVPGTYTLVARTGLPSGRGGDVPPTAQITWATDEIRVDGQDIKGLSLRLAPGQKIGGRVVFDGAPQAGGALRASITARPVTPRGITVTSAQTFAGAGTEGFSIGGLVPAPYRLSATSPGWMLKSAMLGDRDVADTPFDVKPGEDVSGLVLTFTNAPAEVSGVVTDGAGKPRTDLLIVLFSQNRADWFSGSRRVLPPVRLASNGRFAFQNLVAGQYYLAALTEVTAADLNSPQFLEQVVPVAIRISLADGEKKTQDLRVAGR